MIDMKHQTTIHILITPSKDLKSVHMIRQALGVPFDNVTLRVCGGFTLIEFDNRRFDKRGEFPLDLVESSVTGLEYQFLSIDEKWTGAYI